MSNENSWYAGIVGAGEFAAGAQAVFRNIRLKEFLCILCAKGGIHGKKNFCRKDRKELGRTGLRKQKPNRACLDCWFTACWGQRPSQQKKKSQSHPKQAKAREALPTPEVSLLPLQLPIAVQERHFQVVRDLFTAKLAAARVWLPQLQACLLDIS